MAARTLSQLIAAQTGATRQEAGPLRLEPAVEHRALIAEERLIDQLCGGSYPGHALILQGPRLRRPSSAVIYPWQPYRLTFP